MKRIAPKGVGVGRTFLSGEKLATSGAVPGKNVAPTQVFERISWDEALETIADKFRNLAADFGSESILPYSYGGTLGKLGYASMDRRFAPFALKLEVPESSRFTA